MWHYSDGTNPHGPIDEAALREMLLRGTVNRNTLIWREGMSEWKSYGSIFVESQPQASSRGNGGNDRPGAPSWCQQTGRFRHQRHDDPAGHREGSGGGDRFAE